MRLGKAERWLLLNAPTPEGLFGLQIDASQHGRSPQETMLRATRKLAAWRLVEVERIAVSTRASDPRRARPVYRNGSFSTRRDRTRRHVSPRCAVWLTPFGAEIVTRYRDLLAAGARIRWNPRLVAEAAHAASYGESVDRMHRPIAKEERERAVFDERLKADRDEDFVPYWPPFVGSDEERERWSICARAAKQRRPKAGAHALMEEACQLYQSESDVETLRQALAERPQSRAKRTPRTATDRFLAERVPVLRYEVRGREAQARHGLQHGPLTLAAGRSPTIDERSRMNPPQRGAKVIWLGEPTSRTHALTCTWALNVETKESASWPRIDVAKVPLDTPRCRHCGGGR